MNVKPDRQFPKIGRNKIAGQPKALTLRRLFLRLCAAYNSLYEAIFHACDR
ncbi:hypothetical protein [Microcoleus sp. herbarium12]|uniref:hypothetical protein n=1 Tax=Microcoleus sp. herbarium12 TaxID=3055437 RepID=UPI002FD198A7